MTVSTVTEIDVLRSELDSRRRVRRWLLRIVLVLTVVTVVFVAGVTLVVSNAGFFLGTEDPSWSGGDEDVTEIGRAAPDLRGVSYDGAPVEVAVGAGEPTVLVFMAHWCHYCKEDVRQLAASAEAGTFDPTGQLVLVSTKHLPFVDWPPAEKLATDRFPGPVLVDTDSSLSDHFGVTVTPTWFFIDGQGEVVAIEYGSLSPAEVLDFDSAAAGSTSPTP